MSQYQQLLTQRQRSVVELRIRYRPAQRGLDLAICFLHSFLRTRLLRHIKEDQKTACLLNNSVWLGDHKIPYLFQMLILRL